MKQPSINAARIIGRLEVRLECVDRDLWFHQIQALFQRLKNGRDCSAPLEQLIAIKPKHFPDYSIRAAVLTELWKIEKALDVPNEERLIIATNEQEILELAKSEFGIGPTELNQPKRAAKWDDQVVRNLAAGGLLTETDVSTILAAKTLEEREALWAAALGCEGA